MWGSYSRLKCLSRGVGGPLRVPRRRLGEKNKLSDDEAFAFPPWLNHVVNGMVVVMVGYVGYKVFPPIISLIHIVTLYFVQYVLLECS